MRAIKILIENNVEVPKGFIVEDEYGQEYGLTYEKALHMLLDSIEIENLWLEIENEKYIIKYSQ